MFGLSQGDWQDLVLSINVHRKTRRLTPYQAAVSLTEALRTASLAEIAEALNSADKTTLQKIHGLIKLPPEAIPLVEWGARRGSISMSTAAQLLRLQHPQEVLEAIVKAVENNLSKEEARQVVQIRERSGKSISDSVQEALKTRPRIERDELILGSLVSDKAKTVVTHMGEETAAKKLRVRLANAYPDIVVKSVRLSDSRFSIMLDEADGKRLRELALPATVEERVSQLVEKLMAAE